MLRSTLHEMSRATDQPNQTHCLTVAQVAEELNVKQSLLQGPIRTGELRGFQFGGRGLWRIGRQDVEDYLAEAYSRTAEGIAAGEITDDGDADTAGADAAE
ncbi:helix-turn-helix domain-containing protein [Pseudarthrobacter sp. fls2-241-R2A-127]|uniref:helix-turn-helix domain-containing protein n=1 Tax=Pseudarthrobacter sp. fls2-241-R2A-127 TaxID=3040303 RepID=UPI002553A871|nr:helix-turn-helix domain-containing protein [Pseudarthrobacter sp. fls2-241-R2A-127]